jgi:hypothetical protein
MLAQAYEQHEVVPPPPLSSAPRQQPSPRTLCKQTSPATGAAPAASAASSPSLANPASSVKRLTPAEVADGQCFHCYEFFTQGHKKLCKQLFCIEVEDDNTAEPTEAVDTSMISIHALTDIHPRTGHTMQLYVVINDARITALLDSRSTHNFVDLDTTARVGIKFGGTTGLRVTVANGKRVQNLGCCKNLPITIGDEPFTLDCYGLALGPYEMVLDVQWLESLGPILWDFAKHTIVFVRNNHRVCWQALKPTSDAPPLLTRTGDVLEDLLHRYEGVITTPVGLLLVQPRCHQIRLVPGMAPVIVRTCRRSWNHSALTCYIKGRYDRAHRHSRRR